MSKDKSSKNNSKQSDQQDKPEDSPNEQTQLEQETERLSEDLKRAQADFINLKRRTEQTQAARATAIKIEVIQKILPALDSLERAVTQKPSDLTGNDWASGVDSIEKQLRKALEEYGVERIDAVGQEFDPNMHEAVAMDQNADGDTEIVTEELQSGYKLGEKVIRPVMVNVGRR